MSLIALSRGHHGTGGRPGASSGELLEDVLVREYLRAAEDRLRELGHEVVVLSGIPYSERHKRAKALKADVYVCAHTNAGGYASGIAFWDHRSTAGPMLAGAVARRLALGCPELKPAKALPADPAAWPGPYNVIAGVYDGTPVGLCYEPFFIDSQAHSALAEPEGLRRVGLALADGIHDYLQTRT